MKADAAAKAGVLRIVANIPICYGDFKKHKCAYRTQMAVFVG